MKIFKELKMIMFKHDHIKTKFVTFILLNIALCLVFFILVPDKPAYGGIQMDFYGLKALIVVYPLFSAIYGIAIGILSFGDYAFAGIMSVVFFVCSLANTLIYEIAEPPAAFAYTGICIAFCVITCIVRAVILKKIKNEHRKTT